MSESQERVIQIKDMEGGAVVNLRVYMDEDGNWIFPDLYLPGINLTTAGTTDATDKRYVSDAELAGLQAVLATRVPEQLLATVNDVDLNAAPETPLFTVPVGKTLYVTRVAIRKPSAAVTTAKVSFGYNAAFNDVISDAAHAELTGVDTYSIIGAKSGAVKGAAGDVFSVIPNTLEGSALTVTIDVFGYYD